MPGVTPLVADGGAGIGAVDGDGIVPLAGTVVDATGTPVAADGIADDLLQIDDEEVPLAVVDTDNEDLDTVLEEVEDEEVPLANAEAATQIWWSWLPVIGAVASAVEGYRRNKKKEVSSDSENED